MSETPHSLTETQLDAIDEMMLIIAEGFPSVTDAGIAYATLKKAGHTYLKAWLERNFPGPQRFKEAIADRSCPIAHAVYDDIRERLSFTEFNGRPYIPLVWTIGTKGTLRRNIHTPTDTRAITMPGTEVGTVAMSHDSIMVHPAGTEIYFQLQMMPAHDRVGLVLLSNANAYDHEDLEKVSAVIDRAHWSGMAHDMTRHRAGYLAGALRALSAGGHLDEIAQAALRERQRQLDKEKDETEKREARIAATPLKQRYTKDDAKAIMDRLFKINDEKSATMENLRSLHAMVDDAVAAGILEKQAGAGWKARLTSIARKNAVGREGA